MPTVVITGSSRGFGLEQAKKFRELGYQVVLSGFSEQNLAKAKGSTAADPYKKDGADRKRKQAGGSGSSLQCDRYGCSAKFVEYCKKYFWQCGYLDQ